MPFVIVAAVVIAGFMLCGAAGRARGNRRTPRAWPAAPSSRNGGLKPALLVAIAGLSCGGCAHYQLGSGSAPTFGTLYVEPVANKTTLPEAREIVSTRLRDAFARDGRVALANSPTSADATLTVTIVDYHRTVAAVREDDTGLARKFDLILDVECSLRTRDGKVILDHRRVEAVREAFTDAGQLQAEYQTLPLLADALASKVVHASLDVW